MDYDLYIKEFQAAVSKLNKKKFDKQGISLFTGIVLNSVAFKAYKPEWSGDADNALTARSRIFFSVWLNEKTINQNRLYYNIHALKLRELTGYRITSRDFAEKFRKQFKKQSKDWDNVNLNLGPLTLMEGWRELKNDKIQKDIIELTNYFLEVSPVIDELLTSYKTR